MSDLPKPLVPADVDLRGLPFMPLDVVRLTDSDIVALSTGEEFKAAVILWAKCWLQVPAASLPDDDRILAHLSGAGARWKRVKAMALHGFVLCADGRWYHPVIAEKAAEAWKHRQAQRDRANRRWQCDGSPAAHAAAPNNDAAAHAAAYPTAMQGTGTGTGTEETTEFCFSTESDSEKPSSTSVSAARKKFALARPHQFRRIGSFHRKARNSRALRLTRLRTCCEDLLAGRDQLRQAMHLLKHSASLFPTTACENHFIPHHIL